MVGQGVPASTAWFVGGELVAATALTVPLAAALQRRAPKLAPWIQGLPYLRYVLPDARDAPFAVMFAISTALVTASVAIACALRDPPVGGTAPYLAAALVWVGVAAVMASVWVDGAFAGATDVDAAVRGSRAAMRRADGDGTARRAWLHAATGVVAGVAAALVAAMAASASATTTT